MYTRVRGAGRQFIVEFPHHEVIRMLVRSVMRLVEHKQADIAPKVDVAMAEPVQEHVGRGDDDAVSVQHATPQLRVLPPIRLVRA